MLMLFNLGNEEGREREAIQALSSYQVEGFLLHTLGRDSSALDHATLHGKPVVLIDRRLGDAQADLVALDNAARCASASSTSRRRATGTCCSSPSRCTASAPA